MSRILIWSPNYAPELTGIPPLVTDAAEWLARRGHHVDVVAPVPNYPERVIHEEYRGRFWTSEERHGVALHRHWLRVRPAESFVDKILYEATSSTMSLPHALRLGRRADVVVCVVPTLSAAAYATTLLPRKKVVLWVQDLVLSAAASVRDGRLARTVLGLAGRIEDYVVRRADRIVVCSPGFSDYFASRGLDRGKIEVVYNWADTDWIAPSPRRVHNGRPTRFLYSGNLGYTQGFETLVEAAEHAGDGVHVDIVGAGNAAGDVARLAAGVANVSVRPPVARHDFPHLLLSADAHVVLQRRISAGANLPSKIATYMASGRPIVASIDGRTPAATLLRASGGAVLVEPESPPELAGAMTYLSRDAAARHELGRRSRVFAEERLSKDAALQRLEEAILR